MQPIVIIGTGLAGYSTARELRKNDKTTPLVMLTIDDGCNYYKPDLSEALGKGNTPQDLVKQSAAQMAETLDADIRTHTEVRSIDPAARELRLADTTLGYSSLVLANGAETIHVPLAGDGAQAVFKVNNLSEYKALRPQLDAAKRVVVMGAGLIGSEFSNDLASHGLAVDCIDPIDWPLQRFLPEACGRAVRDGLADAGVNWHLGHTVAAVHRDGDGLRVELDDGASIVADVVLSAIGLRPSVTLAQEAGLEVAHGVVVDRNLQTSDPNIYALGDCAEVDGLFRPFVAPLMQAARALGKTLAGEPTAVRYPALPVIVKTPACPTVVYPPMGENGDWVIEGDAPDLAASHIQAGDQLTGFALTGEATKQRGKFIKAAPPMLG